MIEVIGWIAGVCFAICGLPQAVAAWRSGHADGVSWGFLILWLLGELGSIIYVLPKGHLPLLFNYLGNLIFILIIIRFKIWRRTS